MAPRALCYEARALVRTWRGVEERRYFGITKVRECSGAALSR
jgi:hypothetical protein